MATLIKILDKTKLQDKTIFAAPASEAPSLTTGLQAFYKLADETDSSGNGNTLTNNGSVSFASGKIGNAAVFDGSNWLNRSNANLHLPYSISFWVNGPTSQYRVGLIGSRSNSEEGELSIAYQEGELNVTPNGFPHFINWGGNTAGPDVLDGNWHHVLVSYDGTLHKVYHNNNLISTLTVNQPPDSDLNLTIGRLEMDVYDFQPFNGSIDAVGIWNRALSDAEVTALYNSGAGIELP